MLDGAEEHLKKVLNRSQPTTQTSDARVQARSNLTGQGPPEGYSDDSTEPGSSEDAAARIGDWEYNPDAVFVEYVGRSCLPRMTMNLRVVTERGGRLRGL